MQRIGVTAARMAVLGMGMLVGACSWFDNGTARVANGIGNAGGRLGMPWGVPNAVPPEQSTTVARLSGPPVQTTPLRAEGGDVWPVPEAPRSTLANPDAAMRGIPTYRPGEFQTPSAPA